MCFFKFQNLQKNAHLKSIYLPLSVGLYVKVHVDTVPCVALVTRPCFQRVSAVLMVVGEEHGIQLECAHIATIHVVIEGQAVMATCIFLRIEFSNLARVA